jgi:trimethylamine:corrinoid methyltransferase-like protein
MNRFSVLLPEQVQSIHDASLRVLSEGGIVLSHTEAREHLLDSGRNAIKTAYACLRAGRTLLKLMS